MAKENTWLEIAEAMIKRLPDEAKEIRALATEDLFFFARLVNPGYMYGDVHRDVFKWLQEYTLYGQGKALTSNKLIMLPRAHLKSHMVATWCAWMILRHPEITMLYVSATAELAETQLFAIKNILESDTFRRYWPNYIHPQEGLREKWSTTKISVDHPERRRQGIRDATIATAGLTTNTTGWHADVVLSDDLVVPENAYTEEGREGVSKKASQFTSIRNAGGFTLACGTRYHPNDIYATWKDQLYDVFDKDDQLVDKLPVWEIKEYVVEIDGVFTWPRVIREDNKAFGFNNNILSRIKAEYSDKTQFFAQYYNNPNDPSSNRIGRDRFQYYNPQLLKEVNGRWTYNKKRLNVYAAVDFAYSLERKADYTAIVVIGVDDDFNIYVLDIERFKTNKIVTYFEKIAELHSLWNFRKLRAEVSVAQVVIVEAIKQYVSERGLRISIDEYRPSRREGSKEERIAAALEHRYDEQKVWHAKGGYTPVLEEELIMARPRNDDVKDALASAVSIAVKPQRRTNDANSFFTQQQRGSRFGGYFNYDRG